MTERVRNIRELLETDNPFSREVMPLLEGFATDFPDEPEDVSVRARKAGDTFEIEVDGRAAVVTFRVVYKESDDA